MSFFFNEPSEFIEFEGADVILRPVDYKNIGTRYFGDDNSKYWKELYELLNVKIKRKVITTVTNEKILEYYNTGHIATLTKNNLFQNWKENLIKVMEKSIMPNNDLHFIGQSVFSATVSQMELDVKSFGKMYNYPVYAGHIIKNKNYYVNDYNQIVSVHYHKIFRNGNANNFILKQLLRTHMGKVISDHIKEFNVIRQISLYTVIKIKMMTKLISILKIIKSWP